MTLLPEAVFTDDEIALLMALLGDALKNIDAVPINPFGINVTALSDTVEAHLRKSGRHSELQKVQESRARLTGVLDTVRKEGKTIIASTISKLALYQNCRI